MKDAASKKKLRIGIGNIIGAVSLRPSRARELEDELYDHALESADAGVNNPIGSLGDPVKLKRAINRSFLLETALFLVSFIIVHAAWALYTNEYYRYIFSFVYIFPNDHFFPVFLDISLTRFADNVLLFMPFILAAVILRRFYFSLMQRGWLLRIFCVIAILVFTHILWKFAVDIASIFYELKHSSHLTSEYIIAKYLNGFFNDLIPHGQAFAREFRQLLHLMLLAVGMLLYFNRSLKPWGRALILITFAIMEQRIEIGLHSLTESIGEVRLFLISSFTALGRGFWIGFYLAVFDRIWTVFTKLFENSWRHGLVKS